MVVAIFCSSSKNTCTDCHLRMSLPITSCVCSYSFVPPSRETDKNECEKVCFYMITTTTARHRPRANYRHHILQPPPPSSHCTERSTHKKKQSSAPPRRHRTINPAKFLFSSPPAFFPNCQLFFPFISFINSRRQQLVTEGEEKGVE